MARWVPLAGEEGEKMKEYIAIDLGGTNVRIATINEQFEIKDLHKEATGQNAILSQLVRLIREQGKEGQVQGIGIGIPGVVDKEGKIHYISNIPGLENVGLEKELTDHTGLPVSVINDGSAAALAEARLGAGKGYESVYYVTVSTGIGGGYVYQGKLIPGAAGYAGEIGGTVVSRNQKESFRGLYPGAIEGISAGDALTERGSRLCGRTLAHAGEVFDAARKGEGWAVSLTGQMAQDLAVMLAGISFAVNPDIFVLGGGCMKGADCFYDKMKAYYLEMTPEGLHGTGFARAELEEPGLLGAVIPVL